MNAQIKRRLIAAGIIFLVALPFFWFARQYRQVTLDPALIAAIELDDADAVDAVLAEGANPSARNTRPQRQSLVRMLQQLIHPNPDQPATAVMVAMGYTGVSGFRPNSPHIVNALLHYGADVNAKSHNGMTALMWSAETGNAYNLTHLIAAGAAINQKDKFGETALNYAAFRDTTDMLKALIAAGADVNLRDNRGQSVLTRVESTKHTEAAVILRKAGARE